MKLMSKPKAVEVIIKSLVSMGLLPHLEFIWEASFYFVREQVRKKSVYELAKITEKSAVSYLGIKIDKQRSEMFIVTYCYRFQKTNLECSA